MSCISVCESDLGLCCLKMHACRVTWDISKPEQWDFFVSELPFNNSYRCVCLFFNLCH